MERPKQEIIDYLIDLKDSGETNMLGAGPYLQHAFDLDRREAKAIVLDWMKNAGTYLKEKGLV